MVSCKYISSFTDEVLWGRAPRMWDVLASQMKFYGVGPRDCEMIWPHRLSTMGMGPRSWDDLPSQIKYYGDGSRDREMIWPHISFNMVLIMIFVIIIIVRLYLSWKVLWGFAPRLWYDLCLTDKVLRGRTRDGETKFTSEKYIYGDGPRSGEGIWPQRKFK